MSLNLEIVTPEKRVYNKSVDRVKLPCSDGEMEILPGHIPLIALVDSGEVRVQSGSESEFLAVDNGFVEVFSAIEMPLKSCGSRYKIKILRKSTS